MHSLQSAKKEEWRRKFQEWAKPETDEIISRAPSKPAQLEPVKGIMSYVREMCIVELPWLKKEKGSGYECKYGMGCLASGCGDSRIKTEEEFMRHFVGCVGAQEMFMEEFANLSGTLE